jgi:2-polyprenyl-6-methoxyphenol hydroxylase-like FAD-dependent oxidoreductase
VKLIFDETVEHFNEHESGIDVTFTKSKEVKTYDLLVAADGSGSRIRGVMLNTKPREQIHDEGMHCAYWTCNKDLLEGSRMAKWHNDVGGRVVVLRPDPDPRGRTRGMFMSITTKAETQMKDRLNRAIKEGNESYMNLMEEQFSSTGWLAPEALTSMRESDDFYCSIFAQIRSPKLQSGRVVLMGDAGYATPGIGTSLAIMGGYVLAGELLSRSGDVHAAAKAYENLMQPFVKSQQGNDNVMQYLNPQTAWGLYIRDLILGLFTGLRIDRLFLWATAVLGIKEKQLETPDYPWPMEKTQ